MKDQTLTRKQKDVCERFGAPYFGCDLELKVGISKNVRGGAMPINGLRIQPDTSTSGWYIWGGEAWSEAADFFLPLHGVHLSEWAPLVLPYLALPPGWRFLLTTAYEDVWRDEKLVPGG